MPSRDPRVDAYIAKAPAFAQPILAHVRAVVHEACPDVVETMKWSVPHFDYQGPMFQTAAFKEHCRIVFWKGALVTGEGAEGPQPFEKVTSVKDVPKRTLLALVKKAAELNSAGVKVAKAPKVPKPAIVVPDYFAAALDRNEAARATFDGFSPSHRREYVEWITEAKAEATRERRMAQALEWLAEGKSRHWKHQSC